jgi:hypothetical protein
VTTASPQSEPDILTMGLDEGDRLSRRRLLALLVAILALIAGLAYWRLHPRPEPGFSLSDLQGVYAGMVRSDGTNDASVIDIHRVYEESGYVLPAGCEYLYEATVLNRVPHEALDGVGTFWALDRSAVSLFSYRFADVASAGREYKRLAGVVDRCRGVHIEVHARPASMGLLTVVRRDPAGDAPAQLGYVLTTDDGTKLAVHVLAFSNTVTWQFRYEPVPGAYAPLTAERVMDSLTDQMRSVQELHR